MVYFGVCSLVSLFLIYDMNLARQYFWLYRLEIMIWIYIMLSILIKLIYSFAGNLMIKLGLIFYVIDLYFAFLCILGLFFYFNLYLQTMYIHDGHYVIMFTFTMFFNSIAYMLSTLREKRDFNYDFIFGFILMEISTLIVLGIFKHTWHILTMGNTRYIGCFIFFSLINLYITYDTYLLFKWRKTSYYDCEYIRGYFCIWTDWISLFWINIFQEFRRPTVKRNNLQLNSDLLR